MSEVTEESWVDAVLRFWFEELTPAQWFAKNEQIDIQIRRRFASTYERVKSEAAANALTSPSRALTSVIVLDQFPRNIFRDTPVAFATDSLALEISQAAIARGLDKQMNEQQREFLYMPFQHSEQREIQMRSVALFKALGNTEVAGFAQQHRDIIERFGRFPHRNAILGRASTDEEIEFLKTHPGF
jgi:uncharacterized protein (DUF924 family)